MYKYTQFNNEIYLLELETYQQLALDTLIEKETLEKELEEERNKVTAVQESKTVKTMSKYSQTCYNSEIQVRLLEPSSPGTLGTLYMLSKIFFIFFTLIKLVLVVLKLLRRHFFFLRQVACLKS